MQKNNPRSGHTRPCPVLGQLSHDYRYRYRSTPVVVGTANGRPKKPSKINALDPKVPDTTHGTAIGLPSQKDPPGTTPGPFSAVPNGSRLGLVWLDVSLEVSRRNPSTSGRDLRQKSVPSTGARKPGSDEETPHRHDKVVWNRPKGPPRWSTTPTESGVPVPWRVTGLRRWQWRTPKH